MAEASETKPKATKTKKPKLEPTYTKAEIQAAAASFGASPDVMAGALRRLDKDRLTRAEVGKAVQDFSKRRL